MKQFLRDEIVPNQFVYDRLGTDSSRKLSADVQQLVSDGLKNQTKIKVDRAISSIVDGDMIIDDSLKRTVGNYNWKITVWKQSRLVLGNKLLMKINFTKKL